MINLPITLTLLRLAAAPLFIVLFYLVDQDSHVISMLLFVVASLTDWLDGYTARMSNQVTRLGEFLDPVADKVLVVSVLMVLLNEYHMPALSIPALFLILREITVSSLREWLAVSQSSIHLPSSFLAKLKTACQMLSLVILIYNSPLNHGYYWYLGLGLLYLSAVCSLFSFVYYIKVAWPALTFGIKK